VNPTTRQSPSQRQNFLAFLLDYTFFKIAMAFISPDSVLPAFVRQLTDAAPVIGLVTTVINGGWLLPQLVAAQVLNRKPRKKPYLIAGISGRVLFWIIALGLWLGLARLPMLTLTLFFTCLGLFSVLDGLASVAWFDIIARAVPIKQRGRLISIAEVVGGLAGLGVGAAISAILDTRRFSFPTNYTLIFTLSGVAFVPSAIAIFFIHEPATRPQSASAGDLVVTSWLKPICSDASFRHLILCRLLVGMITMVSPFYVIHASDVLHLPERIIGNFVAAQTLAGVVAGGLLGIVSERYGPRRVFQIGAAIALIGPLFALAAHQANGLALAYPLVYVTVGVVKSSWMLGFYNYMLEIAPNDQRPVYIGLGNTIMGLLTLAPTLGGWLLERTSYTVLFALVSGLIGLGAIATLTLKPASQIRPQNSAL
jgi:MFS family permease